MKELRKRSVKAKAQLLQTSSSPAKPSTNVWMGLVKRRMLVCKLKCTTIFPHIKPAVSFNIYRFPFHQMYCSPALSLCGHSPSSSFTKPKVIRIHRSGPWISPKLASFLSVLAQKVKIKWTWKLSFLSSPETFYR